MAISRREIIKGTALSLATALWPRASCLAEAASSDSLLLAASRKANGRYAFLVLSPDGTVVRELMIQGRGHDFAFDKRSGKVVAFARRPGRFALAFNARDHRQAPALFVPPINRHFYGHGTYSADGQLLYATENDFDGARGVVGVYNATAGYKRIGEFSSFGIGPHDIALSGDGNMLIIANGGIETHPESGREKLNIATMAPSLCFVDIETGSLVAQQTLDEKLQHLSIRHLALGGNGTVWFAGQWEDDLAVAPGLIGRARHDEPIALLQSSISLGRDLKGYIGSVVLSQDQKWLAASAPRADQIVYFDTENMGRYVTKTLVDGCGLAPLHGAQFAASSGYGVLRRESPGRDANVSETILQGYAFDNHMRTMT